MDTYHTEQNSLKNHLARRNIRSENKKCICMICLQKVYLGSCASPL